MFDNIYYEELLFLQNIKTKYGFVSKRKYFINYRFEV